MYATRCFCPFEGTLEVNLIGYLLIYANPNVDKEFMRDLDVRASDGQLVWRNWLQLV